MIDKITTFIKSITKRDIINWLLILVLFAISIISIRQCSSVKSEYGNNVKALNDTIKTYKTKNGALVATNTTVESDLKTLKSINASLYDEIKSLKTKKSVTSAVHISGTINNQLHDTIWMTSVEEIKSGVEHEFDFNNEWRTLEGVVGVNNDSINVSITKDQVMFDYTLAIDKSNNVYVKSSNPYVKYKQLEGFKIPAAKQTHWSLGPAVNFGYDPIQNKPSFSIGISLNYGIIRW